MRVGQMIKSDLVVSRAFARQSRKYTRPLIDSRYINTLLLVHLRRMCLILTLV